MKTKIDEVYSEIRSRLKYNLKFSDNSLENIRILDQEVEKTNITKCNLEELEIEYPYSSTYLMYMLQSENNIPFGICPDFKCWYSLNGFQARCRHEQGPKQVHCRGIIRKCSRMPSIGT